MKYAITFPPDGATTLPQGIDAESVAEDCRDAALAFMHGVAQGWDKLDLAFWLTGAYTRATRHGHNAERVTGVGDEPRAEVSPAALEDVMRRARGQLLASLEKAALADGTPDFVDAAVSRKLVRRAEDRAGNDVWVPVDRARMRLRDRLESLFAADCLNAPSLYSELLVCRRCEAIAFDARAKRAGVCGAHRISGMIPREDDFAERETQPELPSAPAPAVAKRGL